MAKNCQKKQTERPPHSLTEWLFPDHTFCSGYSVRNLKQYPNGLIRYDDWLARERDRINDRGGSVKIDKWRGKWALVKHRPAWGYKQKTDT